jgi:hypothetical protein
VNGQQQCVAEISELHGIMVSELNGLSTMSELNENNGTMFEGTDTRRDTVLQDFKDGRERN